MKEEDISRSQNETTKNVLTVSTRNCILCLILTVEILKLEKLLDDIGTVNLFKFVVNPKDFAQSVENIFYLSFLIRDGKVAFETQDGEPVICKTFC